MAFHLLTLKLQNDIPELAANYDEALRIVRDWRRNYVESYNSASAAHSYYKDKRSKGSEAAELMAQAIITGKMKFVLTPSGNVTVQEAKGVFSP
jgi:hypothetical protein